MSLIRFFPILCALSPLASAQDGGQLYGLYCAACHADDGLGATGGTFPPLAGSPWVAGGPELGIKIILNGLNGPIDVLGKSYNLEMPPQGAVLSDEQIAAILTYVRSSWGNSAEIVTTETVRDVRASNSERKEPWTQEEILKLHPLKLSKSNLENVISRVYFGQWQDLPDFDRIMPENIEEEHDGIISVSHSPRKDHFGLVWEADFLAPADGEYTFRLDADDAGRVLINETRIAEVRGTGPIDGSRAKEGKIQLTKGSHPIRIEYMEFEGQEGISLGWKGPGIDQWRWLSDQTGRAPQQWPNIPIQPSAGRTAIYRNFIAGTSPRAIGFGFPGGINLAYSADRHAPELIWTGAFMDGGHHWTDRGAGDEPPAGENVITLSQSPALSPDARFLGYNLDPAGNPTFSTAIGGGQILQDSWQAGPTRSLTRSLVLEGGGALDLLVSDRLALTGGGTLFSLGNQLEIEGGALTARDGKIWLTLHSGQPLTLQYRFK